MSNDIAVVFRQEFYRCSHVELNQAFFVGGGKSRFKVGKFNVDDGISSLIPIRITFWY